MRSSVDRRSTEDRWCGPGHFYHNWDSVSSQTLSQRLSSEFLVESHSYSFHSSMPVLQCPDVVHNWSQGHSPALTWSVAQSWNSKTRGFQRAESSSEFTDVQWSLVVITLDVTVGTTKDTGAWCLWRTVLMIESNEWGTFKLAYSNWKETFAIICDIVLNILGIIWVEFPRI